MHIYTHYTHNTFYTTIRVHCYICYLYIYYYMPNPCYIENLIFLNQYKYMYVLYIGTSEDPNIFIPKVLPM